MFKIFKNQKLIKKEDYEFLDAIVQSVPEKYSYLKNQITQEFILDKRVNNLGDKFTYTLILNAKLENKYSDRTFPQLFIIKNVLIWNKIKEVYEEIELHIMEGMIAGFRVVSKYSELDFNNIDSSKIIEKHFVDESKNFIEDLLNDAPKNVLSELDESTFKIEIPEGQFYVIKDLGDGNYLSIDKNGAVYGMIHDPYEVEKLFNNKKEFYSSMESGKFDISSYYNSKMA